MSEKSGGGYPKPGHEVQWTSPSSHFSHVKKIGPEYNMAATSEREKAPIRRRAPELNNTFQKAHEGPREKLGKPELHAIYTPSGKVMAEIHTKEDEAKRLRNRQKDMQMKRWREVKITKTRQFNTLAMLPMELRPHRTPEVFAKHSKKAALKKQLDQKQDHSLDEGQSR